MIQDNLLTRLPTYENIGSVSVERYALTDEDPTHHCNRQNHSLELIKLIDGVQVESNRAANVPAYQPGEAITWTYEIKNSDLVAYPGSEIALTDSDPSLDPLFDPQATWGSDGILSPGETWLYTAIGVAQNLTALSQGPTWYAGVAQFG